MTGALAGLALAFTCYAYLAWLLGLPDAHGRHQMPPDTGSQSRFMPVQPARPASAGAEDDSDWLPATRPVPPAPIPPWSPRVCAGRVASIGQLPALRGAAKSPAGWIPPAWWAIAAPERMSA